MFVHHRTSEIIGNTNVAKMVNNGTHNQWRWPHTWTNTGFLKIISININDGGFVYRLGHKIFILGRGVRFPYPLQITSWVSETGYVTQKVTKSHVAHNHKIVGSTPTPATKTFMMQVEFSILPI